MRQALRFIGTALLGALVGYVISIAVMAFVMIGFSTTAKGVVGLVAIIVGAIVALWRKGYITRNAPKGASS